MMSIFPIDESTLKLTGDFLLTSTLMLYSLATVHQSWVDRAVVAMTGNP